MTLLILSMTLLILSMTLVILSMTLVILVVSLLFGALISHHTLKHTLKCLKPRSISFYVTFITNRAHQCADCVMTTYPSISILVYPLSNHFTSSNSPYYVQNNVSLFLVSSSQ